MSKPNEVEFQFQGATHTYEPKPITLALLQTVGSIDDPESKANDTAIDVLLLRRVDGEPASKVHIGLRIAAGMAALNFLTSALAGWTVDGSD